MQTSKLPPAVRPGKPASLTMAGAADGLAIRRMTFAGKKEGGADGRNSHEFRYDRRREPAGSDAARKDDGCEMTLRDPGIMERHGGRSLQTPIA
jgi:hypothetical protein